jgi:hypothetical protein
MRLLHADTGGAPLHESLLQVLCHGRPAYDVGYVGWGSPGFFSMVNSVADELLFHVYRGERPRDVLAFYRDTRLIGYGKAALAEHFEPWSCDAVARPLDGDVHARAVPALLSASRYTVMSRLLHILYRPRTSGASWYAPEQRFDVAVHLRRGDKLVEARNAERIAIWNASQVVTAVTRLLKEDRKRRSTASSSSSSSSSSSAAHAHTPSTILLASDDNAFALLCERMLVTSLPQIQIVRPPNAFDKGTAAPFDACSAECIRPLQQLMAAFARSRSLLLSTRSNMGAYFLTHWGAANHEAYPSFIDMEGKTHFAQLLHGRGFCALGWGSRHGMCESNRTRGQWFGPPAGGMVATRPSELVPSGLVPARRARAGEKGERRSS